MWSSQPLHDAIDALRSLDLDELDVRQLQGLLHTVSDPLRALEAARMRIAGALRSRELQPIDGTEGQRPTRQTERFLSEEIGLTPAEAKRTAETGRRLQSSPRTGAALDAGELTPQHATVITDTLQHIPLDQRDDVELDLVRLASRARPLEVAREGRRRIALADLQTAERLEQRRHARRRASWQDQEDGALRISALLYGVDAEIARVALQASTPEPSAGDHRTHDQRRADGFVALCNISLRAAELPTQHGVRPHALVTVDLESLRERAGVARLGSGEAVTLTEARRLLADCSISRVILGLDDAPVSVSETTRTVPMAVWRLLVARDGGCTWAGCDAPLAWCEVAHGDVPFGAGGGLSLENAALLCGHHHRQFDRGGWRIVIEGRTVRYRAAPDRPPVGQIVAQARHRHRSMRPPRGDPGEDHLGAPSRAPRAAPGAPGAPGANAPPNDGRASRHPALDGLDGLDADEPADP